jgi:hypothetical protein
MTPKDNQVLADYREDGKKDRADLPILRRTLEERRKLGYTPQQ